MLELAILYMLDSINIVCKADEISTLENPAWSRLYFEIAQSFSSINDWLFVVSFSSNSLYDAYMIMYSN